jgi:hypothetical protein
MKMKSIKIMIAGLLAVPMMALGVSLFVPASTFAVDNPDCTTDMNIQNGVDCTKSDTSTTPTNLFQSGGVFQIVVNVLLFLIGAIAVIMLIYGGIRYTISGGDSKNVTAAKDTILYSIVGIIVAVLAFAIVNFVINGLMPSGT